MKRFLYTVLFTVVATLNISAQELVEIDLTTGQFLNGAGAIDFVNGRLVIAGAGEFYSPTFGTTYAATVLISDDNGNTVYREDMNQSGNEFGSLTTLEVLDESTFLVSGSFNNTLTRVIWKTLDAGENWIEVHSDIDGQSFRWVKDIECFGNQCLAASSSNKVFKSNNGGSTWYELSPNVSTLQFNEVVTQNGVDWYISSFNELLHYSDANGFSTIFDPATGLQRIVVNQDGSYFITAYDGKIYHASNPYGTWDSIQVPTDERIVDAWADGNGVVYALPEGNEVYYSEDGGQYWYYQVSDQGNNNNDLHFDNATGQGYIAAQKAYRIEAGVGEWLPWVEVVDLPDTACIEQDLTLNVYGNPNWQYEWFIDDSLVDTGINPTISFNSEGSVNQSLHLEVSYNGQTNVIDLDNQFVLEPTTTLINQPTLLDDTLCMHSVGVITLPANDGLTVYEIYNADTLLAGPYDVQYNVEVFESSFFNLDNLEVRATRTNYCGELTTVVPIDYYVEIPIGEADVSVPEWVCTGEAPEIEIQTRDEFIYVFDQDNASTSSITGTGGIVEMQLPQFWVQYEESNLWIEATAPSGCSLEIGPFIMREDSIKAQYYMESSVIVDSLVKQISNAWGDTFYWDLPGASILSSYDTVPEFSYPTEGDYVVTLYASTEHGCADTLIHDISVFNQVDVLSGIDTCSIDTMNAPYLNYSSGVSNPFYRYNEDRLSDNHVDADGNVYLVGCRRANVTIYYNGGSGPNAFIQKYDAFGNLLWEKIETSAGAGGEDYHMSMCTGIDVDPHGNLYVTGTHSHGDAGDVDLFEEYEVHPNVPWSTHYWSWLAKISPTGEILWVRLIERDYTGVHAGVIASDVFYVNDGRILVSALEARTSGEPHSILAFDSAGTIVNSAPFGGWGIGNGCSVISRRPYSVVANYENMQIVYGPKFEGLTNGSVRLKGDFISCEGEIFGSNVLEGHGFVHADLAADLTWSDARFKIEGELIGSSAFDVNGFELPIVVEDQEGNEYMAFDFWGNFSIGGSSFETTREGTALAKLNEDGDLVWLFADTLNYAEYSNPFNYSQQVTSIDIVNNNQGILLKGNYLRMAKFSGMNGSFAQYNNEEKNAYRGRFLNYYDLDGNLIWSKNLKNDHIDFSFWSSSTHGCGDVEFYDQFSTLVDSATNEWQAQVVFTKMSFDCSGSSPCDTRTINMLSADQMVCSQDTITLQTSIVGSLDSLRWHVYQSGHFVPLFGGGTYEHETTDSLVLFDVPNQFVQEVFRLTGYYDNGNETHSNVVQILSEPEFEYENHFINLTCPSVRLYHSDTVDILIDGVYVATLPNTYTQVDTLLHPHLIQLRYLGGCDYVYSDSIQFIPNGVEITEQPQDVFVNQSSTDATFVVEGPNIDQYQWQQSSDNINWNDLQNTLFGPVQGVNTNSLQLVGNSTLIQKAGFYFRVNVENGNCQSVSESGQLVMSTGLTENSLLQFTVLPNPNVGRFEVRVENLAPLLLELFDSIGKKIYSERIEESHRISVNLESGVYLAKVTNSDGNSATKRVVVRSN